MMITQAELKSLFRYEDGNLIRLVRAGSRGKVGAVAGTIITGGYIQVTINRRRYFLHRLIYVYHYGEIPKGLHIDHIDGVRCNNKIENLRAVTLQENQFNRRTAKGYYFNKQRSKYMAQIAIKGKVTSLGYYDTKEEARQAYLEAKEKYHTIKDRR